MQPSELLPHVVFGAGRAGYDIVPAGDELTDQFTSELDE
jgi:hypothetical protein